MTVIYDALRIFFLPLGELLFRIIITNSTELSVLTSQTDIFVPVLFNYRSREHSTGLEMETSRRHALDGISTFPLVPYFSSIHTKFPLANFPASNSIWICEFSPLIILTCCRLITCFRGRNKFLVRYSGNLLSTILFVFPCYWEIMLSKYFEVVFTDKSELLKNYLE